jgi:hypothetical protein
MGRGRWGAIVLGVALLVASCGDDGGKSSASSNSGAFAQQGGSTGSSGSGRAAAPVAAGVATVVPPTATPDATGSIAPLTPGSDVVYTGTLDVRVSKVDVATRDAQQKVTAAGGYLFSQHSSTTEGAPSASLVFKVPPGQFLPVIDALGALGTEVARNVSADDVSAQVVDLQARLDSAKVSLARTRDFIARATNITDIVTLEAEITKRETTVEQLQGQLNVLQSQVAAATITLTVGEKLKDSKPTPSDNIPGVFDGLRAGAVALYNTIRVVGLVLFALLPWLPVIALLWFLYRRISRWLAPRRVARDARLTSAASPLFVSYRPAPGRQPPPPRPTEAAEPTEVGEPSVAPDSGAPPSEIADPPKDEPGPEEPAD